MVDLISNLCDARQTNELNANGREMCMEGRKAFIKDIRPLIEIRHEIGAARLKENGATHVNRLKSLLNRKGKIIEKKIGLEYQRNTSKCEDSDVIACGYIAAQDSYIELFGPLRSFGEPDSQKASRQLRSANQAFLFTEGFDGSMSEVMFDTGTESTLFSPAFLERNTGSLNKLFELSEQGVAFYESMGFELSFGGMSYDPMLIGTAIMVEGFGATEDGHVLNAMIGLDFILRRSFAVDYDERTVTLGHDVDEMLKDNNWEWVPFEPLPTDMNNYQISVLIYFNGRPLPVVFDSGSSFTNISQNCLKGELLTEGVSGMGYFGIRDAMSTEEKVNLKFGGNEHSSNVSVFPPDHPMAQMYLMDQLCGSVGLDEQQRFNYIIDPDAQGIYLKPRENFNDTAVFQFGIIAERIRQGSLVRNIEHGSPAELAGIKPGDVITAIDGRDTTKMSAFALSDLQWTDKDKMTVEILRQGSMHFLVMKRVGGGSQ